MKQINLGDYVDFSKNGQEYSGIVETTANQMGTFEVLVVDDNENEITHHIGNENITNNHGAV